MVPEVARLHNDLQVRLSRYVNGLAFSRPDRVEAALRPGVRWRRQADELVRRYAHLDRLPRLPTGARITVEVPEYAGSNRAVRQMMTYLAAGLRGDLVGAYVHGSLGSGEAIAYSDFDALVILEDAVLRSPPRLARAARRLCRAQAFMLAHDPLQHHGWVVLTSYDLQHYCDAHFPVALFRHAKSLLADQGNHLVLQPRDARYERYRAFEALASGLVQQLEAGPRPVNLYQLKGLLSQFMLLPSLYVQVQTGQGVWKADSFGLARQDFEPAVWKSMEAVSEIRGLWDQDLSLLRRWILARPTRWSHALRKRYSPAVPMPIASLLPETLYEGMARLTRQMQERIASQTRKTICDSPA